MIEDRAEITEQLWRFARADAAATEFERWAYATPALEAFLGSERYLRVIGEDYRDARAVYELRWALRT